MPAPHEGTSRSKANNDGKCGGRWLPSFILLLNGQDDKRKFFNL
jgi:hypothetical protein